MKKLLATLLVACLALPTGGATALAAPAIEPLAVSVATPCSGYLYSDMWGNNTVDVSVRSLLHGYRTIALSAAGDYAADGQVVTALSVEDLPRGQRTYTVSLADDLCYCDGTPITAADYVFTVLLQSDPAIPALGGVNTNYAHLLGYAAYATGETGVFAGVRLLGERQFSLTISADALPYFYELTYAQVEPTPPGVLAPGYAVRDDGRGAYLQRADAPAASVPAASPLTPTLLEATLTATEGYLHQPAITCGPYQLAAYDPAASTVTLTLNPRYKGNAEGRKGELPSVRILPLEDSAAIAAFANGQVQLLHNIADAEAIAAARQLRAAQQANLSNHLSAGYAFLSFACELPPTDDPAVRKAIAMCLDRDAFCTTLYQNNALPVYGQYSYAQWMLAEDSASLSKFDLGFDVAAARTLLAQAGYTYNEAGEPYAEGMGQTRCKLAGGVLTPLALRWAKTDSKAAELVRQQLTAAFQQLGIRLTLVDLRFDEMLGQYYRAEGARTFHLFFLSELFPFEYDPYPAYRVDDAWQGTFNVTGLRDEAVMDAALRMRRVPSGDTAAYLRRWNVFQERWAAAQPAVPLYCRVEFDLSIPTVSGFVEHAKEGLAAAILYAGYAVPDEAAAQSTPTGTAPPVTP